MERAANKKENIHKYRYERKFHIRYLSHSEIKSIIRMHPASFRQHHPTRSINNIYFDTQNYAAAIENIEGIAKRVKTRVRWYGDSFGIVNHPVLEYKIKNGFAGRKVNYILDGFTLDEDFTARKFRDHIRACKIPAAVSIQLNALTPMLLNNYRREYFLSADGKFRLTIDNLLRYSRIGENYNNFRFSSLDKHSTILELKYDDEYDDLAERITNRFPFRVTKNSKYVTGVLKNMMLFDSHG